MTAIVVVDSVILECACVSHRLLHRLLNRVWSLVFLLSRALHERHAPLKSTCRRGGAACVQISDFTFRVGVDAVVSVQLLMSLLFVDGLAKYCVSVYDIDWLFLVCALSRRHPL